MEKNENYTQNTQTETTPNFGSAIAAENAQLCENGRAGETAQFGENAQSFDGLATCRNAENAQSGSNKNAQIAENAQTDTNAQCGGAENMKSGDAKNTHNNGEECTLSEGAENMQNKDAESTLSLSGGAESTLSGSTENAQNYVESVESAHENSKPVPSTSAPGKTKNYEKMVKLTLLRCGVKCDHSGFEFLIACILATIENPEFLSRSGPMFKLVAQQFGISDPARIKSNIHNAILHTYKTHGFDYINQIYGIEVLRPTHKPSPVEFIRLIVEYFTLGLYTKQFPNE